MLRVRLDAADLITELQALATIGAPSHLTHQAVRERDVVTQTPTIRDQIVALLTDNTAIGRLDAEWAAGTLLSAGLLRPEPRVWRAGDPEPDDVKAVVDQDGPVDVLYTALRTRGGGELEDEAARLIDALHDAGWVVVSRGTAEYCLAALEDHAQWVESVWGDGEPPSATVLELRAALGNVGEHRV